jgi:NAD(P)-dependent dehydrogenase (short-subunit alcohol dehydrogenase family)
VLEDACRVAPLLEAEGADYLSVTAGVMGGFRLTVPPLYERQGCFADMAQAVKQEVGIPVATVGRVKRPAMADELVRDGVVDFVCMGRALIADSQAVAKARRGELADIRPCLAECRGCIDQEMRSIKAGQPGHVSCVVNPRMQRESVCIDIEGERKEAPRRVLVVGGGLAGLEAARRTAFAGHKVVLCESRDRIGGQIRLAAMIPGRGEIADILPWYQHQLEKYGVDLRLRTTVDRVLLEGIAPDVVFVATGSVPQVPQGMLEMVYAAEDIAVLMPDDLLEQGLTAGKRVLVVGGDQIGMQIADYLSERGSTVFVVEADGHFASKMAANDRWYLVGRTIAGKVTRFKNVKSIGFAPDGSIRLQAGPDNIPLHGIDTIVFASERRSVRALAETARELGCDTYIVGDAADIATADSGTIFANIAQAYDRARQI